MNRLAAFWDSSVGKKAVMAVTGIIGVLFVLGHMVGNLQVFQGADRLNAYGRAAARTAQRGHLGRSRGPGAGASCSTWSRLRSSPCGIVRRARVAYAERRPQVSTLAARTLRWGGVLLLVFIVYHLLDITIGTLNPHFEAGNVYGNLLASLQRPVVALFYLAAMGALGLHLYHGAWSSLRSLGVAPGLAVAAQAARGAGHRHHHRRGVCGGAAGGPAGVGEVAGEG